MVRINVFSVKQVREKTGLYEFNSRKIHSPQDAYNVVKAVLQLQDEAQEKFGIITLNSKQDVAGVHVISMGSLNSAIVHPREVFKAALLNNAASFICFHNHPSGDPAPSAEDIGLTKRLMEVGEIIGIEVLDHIVVGEDRFLSLKELGVL